MKIDDDGYPPRPRIAMRCGDCGGKLVDVGKSYVNYTHEGPMMERHGSWPVEPWDDDEEILLTRWESWRPPSWEYPPLPGVPVNALPPEPPVGTRLAMQHRPDQVLFYRNDQGWRMPDWDGAGIVEDEFAYDWLYIAKTFGPLVVVA